LGAYIARISSPSKDCKGLAWHTYNLPSVTSTAISDVNGSLRQTLGKGTNKFEIAVLHIALHKHVKGLR
jgi:hypothetical protein